MHPSQHPLSFPESYISQDSLRKKTWLQSLTFQQWLHQRGCFKGYSSWGLFSMTKKQKNKKTFSTVWQTQPEHLLCQWCSRGRPSRHLGFVKFVSDVTYQHFCDTNHFKFRLHVYEPLFSSGGGGGDVGGVADRQEITVHLHFSY